jgi:pimeloyl-ACP methyl ester carboxylesterase
MVWPVLESVLDGRGLEAFGAKDLARVKGNRFHTPSTGLIPRAYRRDIPSAQVHVLEAGHFALDTAADEIATLVRAFLRRFEPSRPDP